MQTLAQASRSAEDTGDRKQACQLVAADGRQARRGHAAALGAVRLAAAKHAVTGLTFGTLMHFTARPKNFNVDFFDSGAIVLAFVGIINDNLKDQPVPENNPIKLRPLQVIFVKAGDTNVTFQIRLAALNRHINALRRRRWRWNICWRGGHRCRGEGGCWQGRGRRWNLP